MLKRKRVCVKTPRECGLSESTEDDAVLRVIGKRGHVLISADKDIRRNELLRLVIAEHKTRLFTFTNNNMTGPRLAEVLARALPQIKSVATDYAPPFIASISTSGSVTVLYDAQALRQ